MNLADHKLMVYVVFFLFFCFFLFSREIVSRIFLKKKKKKKKKERKILQFAYANCPKILYTNFSFKHMQTLTKIRVLLQEQSYRDLYYLSLHQVVGEVYAWK